MSAQASAVEGLRSRKKRETRARIYTTSRRLFIEQGFAETTVEAIAAELDISTVTFFNYFGSKDAVLLEIAEEMIARFEAMLDDLAQRSRVATGLLGTVAESASRHFDETFAMNRRLYVEILRVTLPHEVGQRISGRVLEALSELLREGQLRGEVRDDLHPEFLAEMAANLLAGAVNNWLSDARHPLGERLGRAVVFLEESLRPRSA